MTVQDRILVTGASGFVGAWLMKALRDISMDPGSDLVSAGRGPGCDVDLDVTDKSAVLAAIRELRPTAVINLAAIAAPQEARKDPSLAWSVNFQGALNLATAVLQEAPTCRFIQVGSSEGYGQSFADVRGGSVSEDCALKPMTVYGATKAAADLAIGQMFFDGLRSIRFRPFNHAGPGQSEVYVISAFARQIARIEAGMVPPVIEVGNLDAHRDFMDVRDVVQAYALAALGKGAGAEGKAFNLASGQAVRIRTILDMLVQMSGRKIDIVISPEKVRPVDIPFVQGDASAALAVFGWTPRIGLEETVSAALSDWRERVGAVS